MIKSVRLKLTLVYIGTITLVVLIFSVFTYIGMRTILQDNIDQSLYSGGKSLEHSIAEYTLKHENDPKSLYEPDAEGDTFFVDDINEEVAEIFFFSTVYIQLQAHTDRTRFPPQIIAKTSTLQDISLPVSQDAYRKILKNQFASETISGIFSFPLRVVSLIVHDREKRPYILQVAMSFQAVQNTLNNLAQTFAILFPILLVVLSVVGFLFMKRAFAPVKKIVSATRSITAEDLTLRLDPIDSRDEIGELADTLNEMIARLDQSFKQISQFSGDVSHELKTPLAELKCNAEVTLRRERSSAEYRQALQNVIKDSGRLQATVENLLLLARMDAGSAVSSFTPVDLDQVFFEVFEETQPLAKHKGVSIAFDEIEPVKIRGDLDLLKIIVANLTLNAIQYTPKGGRVTFGLTLQAGQAVFRISDTGIGIPENHLARLFDRFYRVEPSRSQDTGGSGLGLAIVKKAVNLHNGKIDIDSVPGKGSTFVITIPCVS